MVKKTFPLPERCVLVRQCCGGGPVSAGLRAALKFLRKTRMGFQMVNINLNKVTKGILGFLMVCFLIGSLSSVAEAGSLKNKINTDIFGVAIQGYDTVAYFTEGRAVKGESKFFYEWNNAKWYFSSAEHRDLFAADPERYAPRYGGYCAASMALTGKTFDINPEAFKIIDGKLYLYYNQKFGNEFAAIVEKNIEKADENWMKVNK
jgi:YHS domain-containing protein